MDAGGNPMAGPSGLQPKTQYSGVVKSFNDQRGWGILTVQETGHDIMVHIRDCIPSDVVLLTGGQPAVGDLLTFEVEQRPDNPNQVQAKRVHGGSQERACNMKGKGRGNSVQGTGSVYGVVKAFNSFRGQGWITCQDGTDVWAEIRDCISSRPCTGDQVQFDLEPSTTKPGRMQAVNITGGSAPFMEEIKGNDMKGKGKESQTNHIPEKFIARNAFGHLPGCVCANCAHSGQGSTVVPASQHLPGCVCAMCKAMGGGKGRPGPYSGGGSGYSGGMGSMGRLY
eukprot:gb/GFBE01068797.1/.p1 GENE.gb/GFBE01068797.1/~~gb/GFBE01068797.1/.p1  ORF type:complete len:282 (+),score=46.40 gb/GFBE01068797.1/:1-846(+)